MGLGGDYCGEGVGFLDHLRRHGKSESLGLGPVGFVSAFYGFDLPCAPQTQGTGREEALFSPCFACVSSWMAAAKNLRGIFDFALRIFVVFDRMASNGGCRRKEACGHAMAEKELGCNGRGWVDLRSVD